MADQSLPQDRLRSGDDPADLRHERDRPGLYAADPKFADQFCRWVGEGRLPTGVDVRRLDAVMKDGHAYRSFTETALKDGPWKRAIAALELSDVSEKSDFYRKLKLLIQATKKANMGRCGRRQETGRAGVDQGSQGQPGLRPETSRPHRLNRHAGPHHPA
jgi:hypothetical protein